MVFIEPDMVSLCSNFRLFYSAFAPYNGVDFTIVKACREGGYKRPWKVWQALELGRYVKCNYLFGSSFTGWRPLKFRSKGISSSAK